MGKRLQDLTPRRLRQTVRKPASDPEAKLKAVRRAAGFAFPAAGIQEMLSDIERGYTR